jgi:hypothetical protein
VTPRRFPSPWTYVRVPMLNRTAECHLGFDVAHRYY